MPRLFIALPVETKDRKLLTPAYNYLSQERQALKTVKPENYHITVKFLGECSSDLARKIERGFNSITCPQKEIAFTFSGIGVFPNLKNPNVIWAGIKIDMMLIKDLHQNIEKLSSSHGFEKDKKKFTPHLTLARVRKGKSISQDLAGYMEKNRGTIFGESAFKKLVLFSSDLRPEGPVYTEIRSVYFK